MLPLEKCTGCTACASACPQNCIEMRPNKEGFLYPMIRAEHCIKCGKCEKVCPVQKKRMEEKPFHGVFVLKNCNEILRYNSSSGGAFSFLAEKVIKQGGVVYGAALSEKLCVEHRAVEIVEELAYLRGSKYVSSYLGNVFREIQQQLSTGRAVLFSGTPCQVEGLLAFLSRPYDNLLTVDLICHGVPSAKTWEEYIQSKERKSGSKVVSANFRCKETGWKNFSMKLTFENGSVYRKPLTEDPFLQVFLANMCLRESCHNCAFKNQTRKSDITLADFWGVENVLPGEDDDTGTSLVFAHSKKGIDSLSGFERMAMLTKAETELAILHNSAMVKSVTPHHFREYFFCMLGRINFDKLAKRCFHPTYLTRLHRRLVQKASNWKLIKNGKIQK